MTNIKPPFLDNQSDFEAAALGVAASLSYRTVPSAPAAGLAWNWVIYPILNNLRRG